MIFTISVDEAYSIGLARCKQSFRYRIYLNRTKTQRFQTINITKLREVTCPWMSLTCSRKNTWLRTAWSNDQGSEERKHAWRLQYISESITLRHRLAIISFSSHVLIHIDRVISFKIADEREMIGQQSKLSFQFLIGSEWFLRYCRIQNQTNFVAKKIAANEFLSAQCIKQTVSNPLKNGIPVACFYWKRP